VKFRVLGPTELYDNVNHRRAALNSHKQRTLMGALIVKYGSSVSAERLGEEVWGDCSPPQSANALQAQVYRLRRLIDRVERESGGSQQRLITRESGYALRADPEQVDSELFMQTVDRARRAADKAPEVAEKTIRSALRLWRGPALQGSRGPICTAGAAMLEEYRFNALELLYDVSLRAQMHQNIIAELEELTISHPLRERFYDQLMVALYRSGHQAQALGVYERARRHLADELGIAPVPALNKRMRQILSHSPELFDPLAGAADENATPQRITVRSGSRPAAPSQSAVRRPMTGAPRPVQQRLGGQRMTSPAAASSPPVRGESSSLDDEVKQLRALVAKLTTQQQALVTTVRHLSGQLQETIQAVERRRPARTVPEVRHRGSPDAPLTDLPPGG
jgi:SARP family transcriptional regulator, regulator of embCAB operon